MTDFSRMKKAKVEVLETTDLEGSVLYYERHENILPIMEIDHDERYKLNCKACQ
jgi:hypothetical protein